MCANFSCKNFIDVNAQYFEYYAIIPRGRFSVDTLYNTALYNE